MAFQPRWVLRLLCIDTFGAVDTIGALGVEPLVAVFTSLARLELVSARLIVVITRLYFAATSTILALVPFENIRLTLVTPLTIDTSPFR